MKFYTRFGTCCLAFVLFLLNGCTKPDDSPANPIQAVSSSASYADIQRLQQLFADKHYGQQLIQETGDKDQTKIYWTPQWNRAHQKTTSQAINYIYIPLEPKLQIRPYTVNMVGTKRYLLVKDVGNRSELDFSIATYMFTEPNPNTSSSSTRNFFDTFTGVLVLKHLANGAGARFVYTNGVTPKQMVNKPNSLGSSTNGLNTNSSSNSRVCEIIETCYWSASCRDNNGNYYTNGAITSGVGFCAEPGREACPDWGMSWYQTSSESNEQCYGEDDPPPPGDGGTTGPGNDPYSTTPCVGMTGLGNQYGFTTQMDYLRNFLNENFEVGYTYGEQGANTWNFTYLQGQAGQAYINFNVPFPIDGYIHSHYAGTLSIFSMTDLQAMYQIYNGGRMNNWATFTAGVVAPDGTGYTVKINDINQFQAFGNQWLSSDFNVGVFETLYYFNTNSGGYNIQLGTPPLQNEASFLRLLKQQNTGLTLFKQNRSTNTWDQLGLDSNNSTVVVPCQ